MAALLELVDELADAGARVFEVTFDAASAEADLGAVRARLRQRSDGPFLVGAGTVLERSQLEAARRAGADFAVAPALDTALINTAVGRGPAVHPGCADADASSRRAWTAGATFVKLFPASAVGPTFVRELRGPLPVDRADPDRRRRRLERRGVPRGRCGGRRHRRRDHPRRRRDAPGDRGRRGVRGARRSMTPRRPE